MTRDRCKLLIEAFKEKRLLVIGDVMLDRFLWGSVSRISPEAPVPVVHVQRESAYPGGAANVARNLKPFTEQVSLIGMRGTDEFGKLLEETLINGRIGTEGLLCDPTFETITKTRIVARQQQVVRVDREKPRGLSDEQKEEVAIFLKSRAAETDAIILEDYGKGLLDQDLVDSVVEIAAQNQIIVTADPNPNNKMHWNGLTVLKPNRLEAFRMADVPEAQPEENPLDDTPLLEVGARLLEKWTTKMVLITLGEHGMILFQRDAAPQHVPVRAQEVFDVSGAGDTAIALLTLCLTTSARTIEAIEISNYASGVVVGKLGTATLTPTELLQAIPEQSA